MAVALMRADLYKQVVGPNTSWPTHCLCALLVSHSQHSAGLLQQKVLHLYVQLLPEIAAQLVLLGAVIYTRSRHKK